MAYVGTGITIAGATYVATGEILSASLGGMSRPAIDSTHHGTTVAKTFIPGDLYDPGELTVEVAFNPATALDIVTASGTITITHADQTAATWAGNGFATSLEWTTPLEERPTATIVYKMTGAWTVTA